VSAHGEKVVQSSGFE